MDIFKQIISTGSSPTHPYSTPSRSAKKSPAVSPGTRPKKINLVSSNENESNGDLDTTLILKALNNSFVQRMSGRYQKLDPNNLLTIVTEFAIDFQKFNKKQDISLRKWCIVQVDEEFLKNKLVNRGIAFCNGATTNQQRSEYNIINNIELPSTIRPYSIVLNMAQKQLHFQSHQNAENHFFINLDTVSVNLQKQPNINQQALLQNKEETKRFLNKPIRLKIEDNSFPLDLRIYLTLFTLPFPFKQNAREEQKLRYLLTCRQSLYRLLEKSIQQSRGNQYKLRKAMDKALNSSVLYYNTRYATEEQFTKYCQSGDVLLFRDNHTFAKVQRAVTNSPYDHVAIVYRTEQYGICIFESNSSLGVGLASWRKLIRCRWFQGIQKIAWRKLHVHKRPNNFDQKISQFIKGNLHKQFGISLPKLLKFKSVTYSKQMQKSYFCSQLAAQLYRFLGLLDEQKSSTQYWPKDFADGNGIQIINGALDAQRQLIFQQSIIKACYPGIK